MQEKLLKLTKQLFPAGRAWWLYKYGIFTQFLEALTISEQNALETCYNILDSCLPDNDDFSNEDATNWESSLGLMDLSHLTLSERKIAIKEKIKYPGEIPARQHYLYLQGRLRNVGFDVYVHLNTIPIPYNAALYGKTRYGTLNYGAAAVSGEIIANYIDSSKDSNFVFGGIDNMKATFLIGNVSGGYANISAIRKQEFRELILKVKPAQTAGILKINYI